MTWNRSNDDVTMKFDSGVKLVEYAFLVMKSIINRYLYDLRILRKNCGSEILSL